jgi:predicted metal-binding protein
MVDEARTARAFGDCREATVSNDLERYRTLALEMGASDVAILPASRVIIDERVRLKCTVPRCLRAGETPHCPPHGLDLDLVRRALARFSWGVLFKCDVSPLSAYAPGAGETREERRRVLSFHRQSGEIVYALERAAYKDGYHLAMGFGGGSCKDYLCQGQICQVLDSGRCRFPHRSRPAMEAVGIDVVALTRSVGWDMYALVDDLSQVPCAITVGIVFVV